MMRGPQQKKRTLLLYRETYWFKAALHIRVFMFEMPVGMVGCGGTYFITSGEVPGVVGSESNN